MIIANLVGGLGNQMFQYACARALSLKTGLPLKFRIDSFRAYRGHNGFELDRVFKLSLEIADDHELRNAIGTVRSQLTIRRILARPAFFLLAGDRYLAEPDFTYWHGLLTRASQGGYLHGYWQSERYFAEHAEIIRADFTFRDDLQGMNLNIAQAISQCTSISVHIRRGDYVSNIKTKSVHGVCSFEYYQRAIDCLQKRFPGSVVFAFSDDPQWVKDALVPLYPAIVLVDHNKGTDSFNDMRLMSLCSHHVIANSSFSWWGGWLDPKLGKTVIAPTRWFANGTDDRDLVPQEWERL